MEAGAAAAGVVVIIMGIGSDDEVDEDSCIGIAIVVDDIIMFDSDEADGMDCPVTAQITVSSRTMITDFMVGVGENEDSVTLVENDFRLNARSMNRC